MEDTETEMVQAWQIAARTVTRAERTFRDVAHTNGRKVEAFLELDHPEGGHFVFGFGKVNGEWKLYTKTKVHKTRRPLASAPLLIRLRALQGLGKLWDVMGENAYIKAMGIKATCEAAEGFLDFITEAR